MPATCASSIQCLRNMPASNVTLWGRLPVCQIEYKLFSIAIFMSLWLMILSAILEKICIKAMTL